MPAGKNTPPVLFEPNAAYFEKDSQHQQDELNKQIAAIMRYALASSLHNLEQRLEKQKKEREQEIIGIVGAVIGAVIHLLQDKMFAIGKAQSTLDQIGSQNTGESKQESTEVDSSKAKIAEPMSMEECRRILKDNLL